MQEPLCLGVGVCLRHRLFELFDLNGSGSLSIQELIAGLSALCIGTPVDKARIVFDQYDTNGGCAVAASGTAMRVMAWFSCAGCG